MPDTYTLLLDATIQHLEDLKARGRRFVSVSPEIFAALKAGQRRRALVERGASERQSARPSAPVRVTNPPQAPAAPDALTLNVLTSKQPTKPTHSTTVLTPQAKAAAFASLRDRAMACVKCPNLVSSRRNVVFGVGSTDAELMFVGEAPGEDEDAQGEPFVGRAGQLLTKIIQTMGLSRGAVYIANILKCRPDTPGQSSGNRKPTPEEMKTCIPYLHEQIDLIQPKVLVALGGTAVEGLLGKTAGIMRLRGNWQTYRGIPLMPTYHPAYLLRNQAMTEKRRVWEDMLQVMEKLGMGISEKQRRFFLK